MLENMMKGLFDSDYTTVISVTDFLLCLGVSLALGLVMALCYQLRSRSTGSFVMTVALLPAVVCVVIMMVNGNVGAGVAVAGAFSLVRFRSAPGTAKEICTLFLAMGAGLLTGMGYLGFAVLFTVVMCIAFLVYDALHLGDRKPVGRLLKITIPEDLDYTGAFDDIFREYTASCNLLAVKTTDMGSLMKLSYSIVMKDSAREKEMIDRLRCRNGNLEISVSMRETAVSEL